ncbi:MAG TPA: NAD(P)/FAD-dependent oxidoreductase [Paenirhodobacter sp.]
MTTNDSRTTGILIIGAGFGGVGLGARLLAEGRDDFIILERADEVGGTWRDNTYPGAACDVPSHLYSFSFLPKPDWSRVFAPGPEIQNYLKDSARVSGLYDHLRFGEEMLSAKWDETAGLWRVTTSSGEWVAPWLVTAAGHLADEHLPAIPGLDGFTGAAFHSARWKNDVALEGKRIGVVGSGASAIQIVPEMAKRASEMVVFQRSAPYMIPRPDRAYSEGEKRLFSRDPEAIPALRDELFWGGEFNFSQRRNVPRFVNEARTMALGHLAAQVPDDDLRAKLTPNYQIGCKRVLISNEYYPALQRPNVTLEASALQAVEGGTVIAASGGRHDLDVLVFATGFEAVQPPFATRVFGETGDSLSDQWNTGMQAYDAIAVHNFPNLFIINGPNTGLGHNSIVYIIETQVDYILGALTHAEAAGASAIRVRPEAEDAFVTALDARAQGSVWISGGCKSWYVDPRSGRLTLVWPDFAYAFRDRVGEFHPEGYALSA